MHGNFKHFQQAIRVGERPPIPSDTNICLRNLLEACWAGNPEDRPCFKEIIEKLREIVQQCKKQEDQLRITAVLEDPLVVSFWYEAFGTEMQVSWSNFVSAFCRCLNGIDNETKRLTLDSLPMKCLKEMLVGDQTTNIVSIQRFSRLLGCFGPLQFPYCDNQEHMLDRLVSLMELPYFHGFLGRQGAQCILETKEVGSFLVRFSEQDSNSLCISRKCCEEVKNLLVSCQEGSYLFCGKEYSSITALVEELSLSLPQQNQKYLPLFYDDLPLAMDKSNISLLVLDTKQREDVTSNIVWR
mmetsp:Transcript_27846/g.42872  ORF Transcript_27846/g.42872 Transcript_27846/m.42872 type:complete len:298 (-) Transcript_27846:19-912(-)